MDSERIQIPPEKLKLMVEHRIERANCWEFFHDVEQKHASELADVFMQVPRELFVPDGVPTEHIYSNGAWSLGEHESSISCPYVVAEMTHRLGVEKGDRILEVGAGSGYQAAVLSVLTGKEGEVYTVDNNKEVLAFAKENLIDWNGLDNIRLIQADGSLGLENHAPYDKIMVTASLPPILTKEQHPLFEQLNKCGRLLAPLGGFALEGACKYLKVQKDSKGNLSGDIDHDSNLVFFQMQGEMGWSQFNAHLYLYHLSAFMRENFGVEYNPIEDYYE